MQCSSNALVALQACRPCHPQLLTPRSHVVAVVASVVRLRRRRRRRRRVAKMFAHVFSSPCIIFPDRRCGDRAACVRRSGSSSGSSFKECVCVCTTQDITFNWASLDQGPQSRPAQGPLRIMDDGTCRTRAIISLSLDIWAFASPCSTPKNGIQSAGVHRMSPSFETIVVRSVRFACAKINSDRAARQWSIFALVARWVPGASPPRSVRQ